MAALGRADEHDARERAEDHDALKCDVQNAAALGEQVAEADEKQRDEEDQRLLADKDKQIHLFLRSFPGVVHIRPLAKLPSADAFADDEGECAEVDDHGNDDVDDLRREAVGLHVEA